MNSSSEIEKRKGVRGLAKSGFGGFRRLSSLAWRSRASSWLNESMLLSLMGDANVGLIEEMQRKSVSDEAHIFLLRSRKTQ